MVYLVSPFQYYDEGIPQGAAREGALGYESSHPAGYRFEMITRCDYFLAMHTHRGKCGFFVHIEQNDIIM